MNSYCWVLVQFCWGGNNTWPKHLTSAFAASYHFFHPTSLVLHLCIFTVYRKNLSDFFCRRAFHTFTPWSLWHGLTERNAECWSILHPILRAHGILWWIVAGCRMMEKISKPLHHPQPRQTLQSLNNTSLTPLGQKVSVECRSVEIWRYFDVLKTDVALATVHGWPVLCFTRLAALLRRPVTLRQDLSRLLRQIPYRIVSEMWRVCVMRCWTR